MNIAAYLVVNRTATLSEKSIGVVHALYFNRWPVKGTGTLCQSERHSKRGGPWEMAFRVASLSRHAKVQNLI